MKAQGSASLASFRPAVPRLIQSSLMKSNKRVDSYIAGLPKWQQDICKIIRVWIHEAEPRIAEDIKFSNRPYFTYKGNVAALLASKNHVNVFIYDPIVPDPKGIINQGHDNVTARSIQIYEGQMPNRAAFIALIRSIVANNEMGGWRKLKEKQLGRSRDLKQ